jgi:hypothetical protein
MHGNPPKAASGRVGIVGQIYLICTNMRLVLESEHIKNAGLLGQWGVDAWLYKTMNNLNAKVKG